MIPSKCVAMVRAVFSLVIPVCSISIPKFLLSMVYPLSVCFLLHTYITQKGINSKYYFQNKHSIIKVLSLFFL
jgi:nicotinamide riboside transporter PnuC